MLSKPCMPSTDLTAVNIQCCKPFESLPEDFKELLSDSRVDDVSTHIMEDPIILMVGKRSYNALNPRIDKVEEGKVSQK